MKARVLDTPGVAPCWHGKEGDIVNYDSHSGWYWVRFPAIELCLKEEEIELMH